MTSLIIDLPKNLASANKQFALESYLPGFAKNKIAKDTEKAIKVDEARKQLKKIRTDLVIAETDIKSLKLLLAIIVSAIVDSDIQLTVTAKKEAKAWQAFSINANLEKIEKLEKKTSERLIQSAENLGHFHSKPFNTLSSVQFCRDKNYSATGEFGFTENQLSHHYANLSISGGSNAFSAFYAILITRINQLSLAEHLVQKTAISLAIQQFFKRFLNKDEFALLQKAISQSLSKTAATIDTLHIMDKQITLPIPNINGQCDYINITPIINPTVFAATNRSIFYVKNQSVRFMNITLGGTNPSNAGTAVGEVAGQNSRLQLSFPTVKKDYAQQILFSLNKQGCYFWSREFKKQISDNLLQYTNNPDIPNDKKTIIIEKIVSSTLENIKNQIETIRIHLQSIDKEDYPKIMAKKYVDFFITEESNDVWLKTLIYSFQSIKKIKNEIDYEPIIKEIKRQFNKQIHQHGGL